MMDRLTIEAAEAAVHPNFPQTEAVLIVELDGAEADVAALFGLVEQVCTTAGAREIQVARTEDQRARFWKGAGRRSRPWARVTELLCSGRRHPADEAARGTQPHPLARAESGLKIGNVFHAGDGNLHPLVCYDDRVEGQAEMAERVASEI